MVANHHPAVAAGAPAAFDPHVATAAALPAAGLPHVARALALPVAVAPGPLVALAIPAAFDPDETGPRFHDDRAGRRGVLIDFAPRGGPGTPRRAAHAAASRAEQRASHNESSEVHKLHTKVLL